MKNMKTILREHLAGENPPAISELVEKYGRVLHLASPSTVLTYCYQILREAETEGKTLQIPKGKRGPKSLLNRPVLSELHKRIGVRLNLYRTLDVGMDVREFCQSNGVFSVRALREIELGVYDLKLSEMLALADILNCTIPELFAKTHVEVMC